MSKSPPRGRSPQAMGASFPVGLDSNTLTEEEIQNFLKLTSEKSLIAIAQETEKLAGENLPGSNTVRGDQKITLQEIEEFMKEISQFKAPKVTRKELRTYLEAFPQPEDAKPDNKKQDVNFLMNNRAELEAAELYELLAQTQIENFDAVEEAFKLLDVNNTGHLTVECFKDIFEKLNLGTIAKSDEEIFKEVADFDKDGQISLDDFRRILTYKPGEQDEVSAALEGNQPESPEKAEAGSDENE